MGLTVKFYDVGHGSCTHIITPNGRHYLVDVGSKPDKSVCKHIREKHLGVGKIDYLVITHPHLDHICDLRSMRPLDLGPAVLQRPKAAFPLVVSPDDSPSDAAIKKLANQLNDSYTSPVVVDPCLPENTGGLSMQIFWPAVTAGEYGDLNNFSSVVVLDYGGYKLVLTGDNPRRKLEGQLQNQVFAKAVSDADVLLAPHHGRSGEYCGDFVRMVNPRITVISDECVQYDTQVDSSSCYGDATRGVNWGGSFRKVFTTRNDGTVKVVINDDGSWSIATSKDEY